ncbi:hypothetical protein ET464_10940 [Paenibacillus protaetiae]|uniref:Type II secretion system protein GspF domain-containing protein n=1 Tax=Paenibacillus protaetiae TaxID=2509456 RepID=A0A4P6F2T4_9BACL|nr:hypothetical protein ET464_10940 [Paenibacillus protaetiae]
MHLSVGSLVDAAALTGQFGFCFAALFLLLRLLPGKRPRWLHIPLKRMRSRELPDKWLKLAHLNRKQHAFLERQALLSGCGVTADPAWYMLGRRLMLLLLPALLLLALWANSQGLLAAGASAYCCGAFLLLIAAASFDMSWLRAVRKLRAHQITKEIYIISSQLLYLADSSLHIHAKLMRCVPFSRLLRSDLERLLAEWYHDPEEALRSFKRKVGTDEGMSFTETIDAIRQHESREYYELLRERIQDYKEKLELEKESRKESSSYVLFVLAGIPILYTFDVFIYPWVQEGQRLFDALG